MSLDACLPAELRGPATTITNISAGLSGAGVYRVDAAGQAFVLKISAEDEPLATWRLRLGTQQLAATAGLAPHVIHTDEARRAVVSAFVVDRSFPAFYYNPVTREAALAQLARTLRRVHGLSMPLQAKAKDPRDLLATVWSGLVSKFALPAFVGDAVRRMLTEKAPAESVTLDSTPSLADCYQRMRAGALNVATGEGQWWFRLALIRESFAVDGR